MPCCASSQQVHEGLIFPQAKTHPKPEPIPPHIRYASSSAGRANTDSLQPPRSAFTINPSPPLRSVSVSQLRNIFSMKKESHSFPDVSSHLPAVFNQETSQKRRHSAPAKSSSRTRPLS